MSLRVVLLFYFFYSINACNTRKYCLSNKTIIVTGGARGIGYAIADNFLTKGAKIIIIVDKNATTGSVAAKRLNAKYGYNKAVFIHGHVFRNMDYWYRIIAKYKIDVLVNNAGVLDEYDTTEMVLTNVAAPISWSLKFRDYNRKDWKGRGGTIINISSRAGYTVFPFAVGYSATKFAIRGFTQNLGHDYNCKKTGIRVIGIMPDFTYTEMTRQAMAEMDQIEDLKKITSRATWQTADAVGRATAEVYSTAATGTLWTVSGGRIRESPVVEYITTEEIKN